MKKIDSVKENRGFQRAYKRGKSIVFNELVFYIVKNRLDYARLGITVTKKIGNSPQRNRIRRIIRAAARENCDILPKGYDIIVVARHKILSLKSVDISVLFKKVFKK